VKTVTETVSKLSQNSFISHVTTALVSKSRISVLSHPENYIHCCVKVTGAWLAGVDDG